VGDASGSLARRDTIQSIHYNGDIDCYITAAQKGAVSIWNSKVKNEKKKKKRRISKKSLN
jgi:WD repeat-containing protein 64